MRKDLIRSALAIVAFTLVLGLVYPLVMTGLAQVAFPGKADGSRIKPGDKVVGSTLLARDVNGSPRSFHPRPSATGYSASGTVFAHPRPHHPATTMLPRQHIDAYIKAEGPYDPGLTPARVPIDAATFSASGVDPGISEANAAIQARRVAAVRHVPLARVRRLISDNTDGRGLGVFGAPG